MLPPRFSFSAFLEDAGEAYVTFGSADPQATVTVATTNWTGSPTLASAREDWAAI